jgi:GT2 family glycosyltransferase
VDWLLNSIHLRSSENDRKILQDSRIVIVDDSGRDEHRGRVADVVKKWKEIGLNVELIVNETNRGVAVSWNRIIKSGDEPYCVLINDDILVSGGWLYALVNFIEANPSVGGCSGFCYFITKDDVGGLLSGSDSIVIPRDPYKKTKTEVYSEENEHPGRVMAPSGCLFAFSREKYNLAGGFDEHYFSFYEEADFGTTLASKGFCSYCLCWPKSWHLWSATFGTAPEINAGNVMIQSRQYYINKWGAHHDGPGGTHIRYMSKIPFAKIKWIYKDKEYEDWIFCQCGYIPETYHQ